MTQQACFQLLPVLLLLTACDLPEPPLVADGVEVPEGFESFDIIGAGEIGHISGMALHPVTGDLYVSDIGDPAVAGDEAIHRVDPQTGTVTTILNGLPLGSPGRMVFSDGRAPFGSDLILADWNTEEDAACCGGRIFRINVDDGTYSVVSTGSPNLTTGDPFGVALADAGFPGSVYVQDFQGASMQTPRLLRIDPDGTTHDALVDPVQWSLVPTPRHIVIGEGDYHGIYALDSAPGNVWHIDADFNLTSFASGPALGNTPATARFGLGGAFGSELYVLGASTDELKTIAPDGTISVFGTIDDADGFADMVFAPGCGTLYVGTLDRIIAIRAVQ